MFIFKLPNQLSTYSHFNPKLWAKFAVMMSLLVLTSCSSAYYSAMEQVGIHKRDIMVDRVEEAKESQQEAQEKFASALAEMTALIRFDGGELKAQYQVIKAQYEQSQEAADLVTLRIEKIEDVSDALFTEWQEEIGQISNANLKRQSLTKFKATQRRYKTLIDSMYKAESKMAPVLTALKDNTLFLKHNLNAQAVGALQGEMLSIKKDVSILLKEMSAAIEQSQKFIDMLEK